MVHSLLVYWIFSIFCFGLALAQFEGSGNLEPIFPQPPLQCHVGSNGIDEPTNLTFPVLMTCAGSNASCLRNDVIVQVLNQNPVRVENLACGNLPTGPCNETLQLIPEATCTNQTVCNTFGCNRPTIPTYCQQPPTNELQILPNCTVRKDLPKALECGNRLLSGYPYTSRSKCRQNLNETFTCLKTFLAACVEKNCPMFLDETPFGNYVRSRLTIDYTFFERSLVNSTQNTRALDIICANDQNGLLVGNLTRAIFNNTVGDVYTLACDNATVRDVYIWSLEALREIAVNGSTHADFCRFGKRLLDQVKQLLRTRCTKIKFTDLIISGLIGITRQVNVYEPYRNLISQTIDYVYDWFLNWEIPTCPVPNNNIHKFPFAQHIQFNTTKTHPEIAAQLLSAFRFKAEAVTNVTIGQPFIPHFQHFNYFVETNATNPMLSFNLLLESYQEYVIQNPISDLIGQPLPGPCFSTSVNGFTFNTTTVGDTAFSNEVCEKGFSKASVGCIAKLQTDPIRGNIFVAQFDKATFKNASCNISLSQQKPIATTEEVSQILDELQLFTSAPNSLNTHDVEQSLQVLEAVTQAVKQPSVEILPATLSTIVHISDSLAISVQAFKSSGVTVPSSSYNAVAAINEASQQVNLTAMGETSLIIKTKQITLQVADVRLMDSYDVNFSPPIVSSSSGELIQPINITVPLERTPGSGNNDSVRTVFVLYENDTLFSNQNEANWVISAILGKEVNSKKLQRPVKMEHMNENTQHGERNKNDRSNLLVDVVRQQCVFWDPQHLVWSNEGCQLDTTTMPPLCKCNHLTSFALLVSHVEVQADVTLLVFSKIGCIISIVALAATIILYLLNRELRKKEHVQIQLHININLLIAYIIFLVGISLVDKGAGCTGVAALIQYFFLAAWMWIAVYSNKLYTSIVKVFSVAPMHYVLKACIVGYIFPLIVVGLNLGLTIGFVDKINLNYDYDPPQLDPQSSSYRRDSMCWVHNYSLYFGFLLIVGLILLNNIVIIVLVVRHVRKMENKVQSSASTKDSLQQVKMVFTMSVTFGITWVIGFFMLLSDDEDYLNVLSWLFTIFNAFLGVLIFYTSAVMRKEIFAMWTKPCNRFTGRARDESSFNGTGNRFVSNPSETEASQAKRDTRV